MRPIRIQRKRIKGWKMPQNTIYVGRPTLWGNPFDNADEYRQALLGFSGHSELYEWVKSRGWHGEFDKSAIRYHLKGKNLACWCPITCTQCRGIGGITFTITHSVYPSRHSYKSIETGTKRCPNCRGLGCTPCHADILLEIANS